MSAAALRQASLVALAVGMAASITLTGIALASLTVTLVIAAIRREDVARLPRGLAVLLGAFVGWTMVSAMASAHPAESLWTAREALWMLAVWVVAAALGHRVRARRWFALLFTAVAVVSVLSVVQVMACPDVPPAVPILGRFFRKCDRAHGFYSIYMTLAGVIMLVLVATLPRLAVNGRWHRVGAAAWVIGLVALGLTRVRGALLGLVVGVIVCVFAVRRTAAIVVGVGVLVVIAIATGPELHLRLTIPEKPLLDDTIRDRLAMLDGGIRMLQDHPWTGVGPGQVKRAYPAYAPREALRRSTSHLHNTPLQIAVERGVIGLALWIGVFAAFFANAFAIYRRLADSGDRAVVAGAIMAIVAFLVAGLFEYNFGDTEVLLVACALMALPFAIERQEDRGV